MLVRCLAIALLMGMQASAQNEGSFSVEDRLKTSINLITAFSTPLPAGVSFARGFKNYPSFYLDGTADIKAVAEEYFPSQFPSQFSIRGTIKSKSEEGGYLFAVTDKGRKNVKFGLEIGAAPTDASKSFITLHWKSRAPVSFAVPSFVDQWTRFSLDVSDGKVTLYLNCKKVAENLGWKENGFLSILSADVLQIGGIQDSSDKKYQGLLQELFVATDPTKAENYCDDEDEDIEASGEESGDGSKEGIVPSDEDEDTLVKDEEDVSPLDETPIQPPVTVVGPKGEPGMKGDPGMDGMKGATGSQGQDGQDGKPGFNGANGDKGEMGEPGLDKQGQKGEPGPRGERGEPGEDAVPVTGLPGPAGEKGEPGEDGDDGNDGEDGEDGMKGERGEQGKGIPGPPGPPGKAMPFDEEGSTFEGIQGPPGPQGPKGAPGLSISGEKGDKGNPGMGGIDGRDGVDGINGRDGIDGKTGEPGPAGPIGETGEKGDPGQNGLPGISGPPGPPGVCDMSSRTYLLDDDDELAEASGDELLPVLKPSGCPRGPTGAAGKPGLPGPQGEIGMPGRIGSKGDRGAEGPQGRSGLPGIPGIQGPHGKDGFDGRNGDVGPIGPRGDVGPVGPPGPPGATISLSDGQQGQKGEKGESGAIIGPDGSMLGQQKGEPGLPGLRGLNGLPGIAGEKGEMGMPGRRGSRGRVGPAGQMGPRGFPGEAGQDGLPGINGEPGPPGPPASGGSFFGGSSGEKGDRGMPGRPGPRGGTGLPGIPGTSGQKGEPGNDRGEDSSTRKYSSVQNMQDNYKLAPLGAFAFVKDREDMYVKTSRGWSRLVLSTPIPPVGKEKNPTSTTESSTTTSVPTTTTTTTRQTTTTRRATPEPVKILSPSFKQLHLIALNSPLSGGMRGIGGADTKCFIQARRAGLPGTYRAFLSTRDQDVRSIVRSQDRANVPIVNAAGEILFHNWNEIFNGDGGKMDPSKILSFEQRRVTADARWPHKVLWHGSYADGGMNQMHHCVSWYTNSKAVTGQASELSEGILLGQSPYGCRNSFVVLCIESNTRTLRYKK